MVGMAGSGKGRTRKREIGHVHHTFLREHVAVGGDGRLVVGVQVREGVVDGLVGTLVGADGKQHVDHLCVLRQLPVLLGQLGRVQRLPLAEASRPEVIDGVRVGADGLLLRGGCKGSGKAARHCVPQPR